MKSKILNFKNYSNTNFSKEQPKILMMYAPNDVISNNFFYRDYEDYAAGAFSIKEKPGKRYENVKTTIRLKYKGVPVIFNYFHRIVLNTCISAYIEGTTSLSLDELYRRMVGDVYNPKSESPKTRKRVQPALKTKILNKPQKQKRRTILRDKILKTLQDLFDTRISIDMTAVCLKWKKYNGGQPFIIENKRILPGKIIHSTLNGKSVIRIELTGESPFYTIAAMKRQILTFPLYLLDIPTKATENMLKIRHSLMMRLQRRIQQGLTNTIILDNFFAELDIEFSSKNMKYKCLNYIDEVFEYWAGLKTKDFDLIGLTKIKNGKHIESLEIDVKLSEKTARKKRRDGQK